MFDIDQLIIKEYSGQSGYGTLPYFSARQSGTGWLRNIAKFAFPFLRKAVGAVGNIAANTAEDVITGQNKSIGSALKQNAIKEVSRIIGKRKAPSNTAIINIKAKKPKRQLII